MTEVSSRLSRWSYGLLFVYTLGIGLILAAHGVRMYANWDRFTSVATFDDAIRQATTDPDMLHTLDVWTRMDANQDDIGELARQREKAVGADKEPFNQQITILDNRRNAMRSELKAMGRSARLSDEYYKQREAVVIEAMVATGRKFRAANNMSAVGLGFLALGGGGFAFSRFRQRAQKHTNGTVIEGKNA